MRRHTPDRPKRSPLAGILALAALAVAAAPSARASSVSLFDEVGDPAATTVAPGGTFGVTVRLDATESFFGYSIFLADPGFAAAPRLTITNRARLATNPYTDATTPDSTFAADPIDAKTADLGYTASSFDAPTPAGTYALMTLDVTAAPTLAPGTYAVRLSADSVLTTADFADASFTNGGAAVYTVTVAPAVVPEPASLSALALAGAALLARRQRRVG